MLGCKQIRQNRLFYTSFNLDQRVREDNPLRQIRNVVDFSFIREQVCQLYGSTGKPSIDPIVLMKLMLILFLEQIPSERELMRRLPERLDWLWFCEYDLDIELPNHSVLSKVRRRWGLDVFRELFQVILSQCIKAGLVDGRVIHVDSSLINANASLDGLKPQFAVIADNFYQGLEESFDIADEAGQNQVKPIKASSADPDARCRIKGSQRVLGYQEHRCVDDYNGIITATITTDASVHEGEILEEIIDEHESNTESTPCCAVGDKAYGRADNYKILRERDITPCIPHAKAHSPTQEDYFHRNQFMYDPQRDCCICPAGKILKRQTIKPTERNQHKYQASRKDCKVCPLKNKCTPSKYGKRFYRHANQDVIDWADDCLSPRQRKHLMGRRRSVMEGSFADATNNHGYKRSRWRRLWRVTIQNLLIAALQNLRKLLSAVKRKPRRANFMEFLPIRSVISEDSLALMDVSTSILQITSNLNRFLMNDEIKIEKKALVFSC
jgi:transposase